MDQKLELGGFLAFSKVVNKTYSWNGNPANLSIDDSVDINTSYVDLAADRTIATATPVHITDPHGSSARWGVEILSKEIVGDTNDPKVLRIHFRVITHGGTNVQFTAINFFGMIFAGVSGSEVKFV